MRYEMTAPRSLSRFWLGAALVVLVGGFVSVPGCGPGSAPGEKVMVKDPPPLPVEETTEELLKNEAKTRAKAAKKGGLRRRG